MDTPEPIDLNLLMKSNSIRMGEEVVFLDLDVTPNASQPGINGYNRWRDRIMVRVRSQARKGQANTELLILLSSILNIDQNQINIIKGTHSGQKTVELSGLNREQVITKIIEALNE